MNRPRPEPAVGKAGADKAERDNQKFTTILDFQGVTAPEVADMVRDFQDQTLLNPRVKNTVGHISLSFSEQDKARLTDKAMTEIAREYMQKMGIENTQYIIVRHHDALHPHCHIVYNRVKNDGTTVPDSNIRRISSLPVVGRPRKAVAKRRDRRRVQKQG